MNKDSDTEYVATLVAGVSQTISNSFLQTILSHIEKSSASVLRIAWLEKGKAVDIFCIGTTFALLRAALVSGVKAQPVDFIVQPMAGRRKKFLFADMESTIIEQETLDEMAAVIGCRSEVEALTARGMRGEIDFATSLRERTGLFSGQPASLLDEVGKRITVMPGAERLIFHMKEQHAICWLVSGGFTYFAEPVASRLGFDRVFANRLLLRDGTIGGEVAEPILDKNTKKLLLEQGCSEMKLSLQQTLAVGDGANDIPMLVACHAGGGLAIAYHAKPSVREIIPNQVNYADLTALLYAQGYGSNQGA